MNFNVKQIQILEAAETLFAEKGFDGCPVRDIAEKAGVNLAMISYYFGSKEKLLESLFLYRAENSVTKIEQLLLDKSTSYLQKGYQLIDYYIDKFQSQPSFHKIISREQVTSSRTAVNDYILEFKIRNQKMIALLVKEGQKSGEFKKNIDIPILMSTLIGTLNHLITSQHHYKVMNKLQGLSDGAFKQHIRKKLSQHFKFIFKAILINES